jgi:DNA-binding transcriptional ArsR family regulator
MVDVAQLFDTHRTIARVEGRGVLMRELHHPSCDELELSEVLHALSDPARLRIVRHLARGDECTCGTFELGLSKATLSHHFRVLREAGVVRTRPDGRKRMLSLREDDLNERFPGLLDAVLTVEAPTAREGALASSAGR